MLVAPMSRSQSAIAGVRLPPRSSTVPKRSKVNAAIAVLASAGGFMRVSLAAGCDACVRVAFPRSFSPLRIGARRGENAREDLRPGRGDPGFLPNGDCLRKLETGES